MGIHTARLPENLEEYIKIIIKKGYATTYGNAINLIILDRMMRDREAGDIAPFKYKLRDARITSSLEVSEIGTENVEEPRAFPLGEPPANAGPGPAPSGGLSQPTEEDGIGTSWREPSRMRRPRYPGTFAEYDEALRTGAIKLDQFDPPID